MIRRLVALALGALATCLALFALSSIADSQQPTPPWRIGVLLVVSSLESKETLEFRQGLREAGYTEGRDIMIEWRSANGDNARVSALAVDLVQRKLDVIVTETTLATLAVKRGTSTIPIVMTIVADPVGSGLVANLAHPGENVTGFSAMAPELGVKRLEMLKDLVPNLTRVAVFWNPDARGHTKVVEALKAIAPSLSLQLSFVSVRTPEEIGPAFAAVGRAHAQALCVLSDAQLMFHRRTLLNLASKLRVPAIYLERRFVDDGGLMSYGVDWAYQWRRSATYVDKILKGTKPGDLPIEQPTKFELVVNLKTAKALGITIPESILLRADEVIR